MDSMFGKIDIHGHREILFICATDEEFSVVQKTLGLNSYFNNNKECITFSFIDIHRNVCDCTVMKAGVTFFNVINIDSSPYDEVINFGTCASLSDKYKLFDVIVSNNVRCADLNLTQFEYVDGTLYKYNLPDNLIGPVIVSGSSFLDNERDRQKLVKRFGAVVYDMESFMYSRLCPNFLSVRAVSDGGSTEEYNKNTEIASLKSFEYAINIVFTSTIKDYIEKGIKLR